MMKRSMVFVAIILWAPFSLVTQRAVARGNDVKAVWQATPVTADGDNSDWPQPYPWYNEKSGMAYAISNDKENLYITFKANDAAAKKSVLSGGVTVYIDTNGGKGQGIAIHLVPAGMPGNSMPQGRQEEDVPDRTPIPLQPEGQADDDSRKPIPLQPEQGPGERHQSNNSNNDAPPPPIKLDIMLQGFAAGAGRFPMGAPTPAGITAAAGYDEFKAIVWEAVIPFKSFFNHTLTAADAGRNMSVGFIFTGMHAHMLGERPQTPDDDMPRMKSGGDSDGTGHGEGGGGRHGGGMKLNNMPMADMSESEMAPAMNQSFGAKMPEKTFRTWQKIAVAWKE